MPDRVISNSIALLKARRGATGAVFTLDLSNDMDSVPCDNNGRIVVATNVYSQIMVFYGSENITEACKVKYTAKPTNASVYLETSASGTSGTTSLTTTFQTIGTKKYIRLNFAQNVTVASREVLSISIKHDLYGTLDFDMVIVGLAGGATYHLVPSNNVVSKNKTGTYNPASITCDVKKIDAVSGAVTTNPTGATIKYIIDDGSTEHTYSMSLIAGTDFEDYITFLLYVNGVIVDRETVSIVEDGLDGVSVLSQYAPNDNPTEEQIHDTWLAGDIYMRTKASSASTWSDWHKIVGETGGETDYSFNIANVKTGVDAQSTYPTTLGYQEWQDNPVNTTAQYKYLWMKIQRRRWDESIGDYVDDGDPSFARITGEPSVKYEVESTNGSPTIPQDDTSVSFSTTLRFYKVEGDDKQSFSTYYAVYTHSITTGLYTIVANGNSIGYNISDLTVTTDTDYIVVYLFSASYDGSHPDQQTNLHSAFLKVDKLGDTGPQGESTPTAYASPSSITVQCDNSATNHAKSGFAPTTVTFTMKVGTEDATVTGVTAVTVPTGVGISAGQDDNEVVVGISTVATAAGMAAGIVFTVTGEYDDDSISVPFTLALVPQIEGAQGQRGKIGRFYYFANDWNPRLNTHDGIHEYSATDTEAPFFRYNNNGSYSYYVYVGEENFTNLTMREIMNKYCGGEPSGITTSDYFEPMTTQFKYLITEAIFGNYAHFGSAIINGDWMISTQGTINGVASTTYTAFDPSHPNDNTGTNFIPNYAVDLLTGATYQNNAYIRGDIYARTLQRSYNRVFVYVNSFNRGTMPYSELLQLCDNKLPNILVLYNYDSQYGTYQLPQKTTYDGGADFWIDFPPASDWQGHQMDIYCQRALKEYSGSNEYKYYARFKIRPVDENGSDVGFQDVMMTQTVGYGNNRMLYAYTPNIPIKESVQEKFLTFHLSIVSAYDSTYQDWMWVVLASENCEFNYA